MRIRQLGASSVVGLLAVGLAACVPAGAQGGEGTGLETPGGAGGGGPDRPGEGPAEGSSADELDARKDRLYVEFKALMAEGAREPDTCERLCALATSICGVQEKLCNIADDHVGDDHYQQLCREAKRECRDSQDRCIECVEHHAEASCGGSATPAAE